VDAFDGDPVAAARTFADAGARWLHVVDLDLALDGEARNLDTVEAIAAIGPRVQAAGGVRTGDEIRGLLAAGATRVVLGSAALADEAAAAELLSVHAERLVVGIEVAGGRIRSRGRDPVDLDLMETLGWLVAGDARRLLVTAVDRVSRLEGPDVGLVRRVARAGRPVLAAGGVATAAHLRALRAAGADGAVVGRAVLGGTLDVGTLFDPA
ncbi:MAG TPA: HisA/HisF-related TIM barrel protein, partial [Actinomycetota bacterium]|nr:HisA/HisF-related TIM barrel protein [Actinomycetota bacterium]